MIDWNKPLQTSHIPPMPVECLKGGLKLQNAPGDTRSILATYPNGTQSLYTVREDGAMLQHSVSSWDVVNVPQSFTLWMNVYKDDAIGHATGPAAESAKQAHRIALYRMRFSESGILEQTERVQ